MKTKNSCIFKTANDDLVFSRSYSKCQSAKNVKKRKKCLPTFWVLNFTTAALYEFNKLVIQKNIADFLEDCLITVYWRKFFKKHPVHCGCLIISFSNPLVPSLSKIECLIEILNWTNQVTKSADCSKENQQVEKSIQDQINTGLQCVKGMKCFVEIWYKIGYIDFVFCAHDSVAIVEVKSFDNFGVSIGQLLCAETLSFQGAIKVVILFGHAKNIDFAKNAKMCFDEHNILSIVYCNFQFLTLEAYIADWETH